MRAYILIVYSDNAFITIPLSVLPCRSSICALTCNSCPDLGPLGQPVVLGRPTAQSGAVPAGGAGGLGGGGAAGAGLGMLSHA